MTNEEKPEKKTEEAIDPKALIRRGLKIIEGQITNIEKEVDKAADGMLGARGAKVLNDYIGMAVRIAKDIKDLGNLSDEELAKMSKEEILSYARKIAQESGLTFDKEKNEN